MAPVCCSSSRPLGVAAKLSRLSNNVSSQMSLWPQSESEKKKNNNNDNNMLQCSESSEQWFFTGSQMEVRWPTGYLKVCILKDRIDLFFLKKIQRNYRRFFKKCVIVFCLIVGNKFWDAASAASAVAVVKPVSGRREVNRAVQTVTVIWSRDYTFSESLFCFVFIFMALTLAISQ